MRIGAAVVLFAALMQFGSEFASWALGGTRSAWFYVISGIEAATLWGAVFYVVAIQRIRWDVSLLPLSAAAWCCIEGLERAVCRPLISMDVAPKLNGDNICDVVTGWPVSWIGYAAALLMACIAQELMKCRKD